MFSPFFGGLNGDGFYDESDYDCNGVPDEYTSRGKNTMLRCNRCGTYGYEWKHTQFGWRLAYSSGELKGKLHACENEGE